MRSKQALAARPWHPGPGAPRYAGHDAVRHAAYSFRTDGHWVGPANRWKVAIFGTGADCALCSTSFAQQNELAYGANPITVDTADGSSTVTLEDLNHPLEFWLATGGAHPCKALSTV